MKSYQNHLTSILSVGGQKDVARKPIFRSSAIFTAIRNERLSTRILFMGYWLVKSNIPELGLVCTLRNQKGKIIYRDTVRVDTPEARHFEIGEMLDGLPEYRSQNFLGSIELEIFASRDLVFPYPAFVVNYYNDEGSSVVHTTGRIYNDFEDMQNNESMRVKECGFDILSLPSASPFFTFVNGFIGMDSGVMEFEIIGENGSLHTQEVNLGPLAPMEAVLVELNDYMPIDELLGGKTGTVKIKHELHGFYPRFIAGNFEKNTGAATITHTYYDNSGNTHESAYWTNKAPDLLFDSTVFVPLFVDNDWYTELKMYPLYSPSAYAITFQFFDGDGKMLGEVKDYKWVRDTDNDYFTLDFNALIAENHWEARDVKGVMIIQDWKDKTRIPTRLKYGLNVGRKQRPHDYPTNICFGSVLSDVNVLQKKSAFKWFPLLNQGGSLGVIENSSFAKGYDRPANIELTFYKTGDTASLKRNLTLPPNGQTRVTVDEELAFFLDGNPGWVTVKSDNPFVKAWYFEFNESGIMGGDHSF